MAVALSTIGFIGDTFGLWNFVESLLPKHEEHHTTYRIQVGIDNKELGKGLQNAGGDIEKIESFNANDQLMGVGSMNGIGSGQFREVGIEGQGTQQTTWSHIFGGDDAACIAYIAATWPDGQHFGFENSKGSKTEPLHCTWIDKNHSENIEASIFAIKWSSFRAPGEESFKDPKAACGTEVGFRAWRQEAGKDQLAAAPKRRKRDSLHGREFAPRMDERLVVSYIAAHNATEECAHPQNWGPDFVSVAEGVYCDMDTRETLPLCGSVGDRGDACFDLEEAERRAGQPSRAQRRSAMRANAVTKTPTRIVTYPL